MEQGEILLNIQDFVNRAEGRLQDIETKIASQSEAFPVKIIAFCRRICYNAFAPRGVGVCHNGGRLTFYGRSETSEYIETHLLGIYWKGVELMSDYELLAIVLMFLAIIIPLLIALNAKK